MALKVVVAVALVVVVVVVVDVADVALGARGARGNHGQGQCVGRATQNVRDAMRGRVVILAVRVALHHRGSRMGHGKERSLSGDTVWRGGWRVRRRELGVLGHFHAREGLINWGHHGHRGDRNNLGNGVDRGHPCPGGVLGYRLV